MQIRIDAKTGKAFPRHSVSDVVSRLVRIKNMRYVPTFGDYIGGAITRLADDKVSLDTTELLLVELKRRKVISGRKMVQKLGQHLKERNTGA